MTKQKIYNEIRQIRNEAFPERAWNMPCGYSFYKQKEGELKCSEALKEFEATCASCGGTDWVEKHPVDTNDVLRMLNEQSETKEIRYKIKPFINYILIEVDTLKFTIDLSRPISGQSIETLTSIRGLIK